MIIKNKWLRQSKIYLPHLLIVLLIWSFVPAIAKLGSMNGVVQTFWINAFATLGLLILIPLSRLLGRKKHAKKITPSDLVKISILGLIWPFAYSVLYFESIHIGFASITTIIGRTNILFYIPILVFILKIKKLLLQDIFLIVMSIVAVIVTLSGSITNTAILPLPLILAFGAAIANGIYIAFAEKWEGKYDALIITLIIEIITTVFSGLLMIINKSFSIPNTTDMLYLLFIGLCANAIAFWLYLEGFQKAVSLKDSSHKTIFLVTLTAILNFLQIFVLSIIGVEKISLATWIGVSIMAAAIFIHRTWKFKNKI